MLYILSMVTPPYTALRVAVALSALIAVTVYTPVAAMLIVNPLDEGTLYVTAALPVLLVVPSYTLKVPPALV